MKSAEEIAAVGKPWSDPEFVRMRIRPKPSDAHYLVLRDLRDYIEQFRTTAPICILDFGAGPSPYRELFAAANYVRADYVPSPGVTVAVASDGSLPLPDAIFEIVLSTQVAEHVANPARYFSEAYRVLKNGGLFIVTTHGVWPDHGVPFDFQRWTAAGLARDLERTGFVDIRTAKLTCGLRAHFFLGMEAWASLQERGKAGRRTFGRIFKHLLRWTRPLLNRFADRRWRTLGVCDLGSNSIAGPDFYMLVAANARKPSK